MASKFQEAIKTFCQERSFPKAIMEVFLGFCKTYEEAILPKEPPQATFMTFLEVAARQIDSPYPFAPFHKAIYAPTNYYELGLDFVRPLLDMSQSEVVGKKELEAINHAVQKRENVILLANHQTEIDPQIISLEIEKEYPQLAQEMIFVAGHRVVTDPLAVPLSLGRNLLCIYSKRHIDTPPEKRGEKLQHNQRALKVLEELLSEGGKIIFIAPSGGRDRRDEQGKFQVAPFDPDAVEMFYLFSQRAKTKTHFHTLALKTYPLLPPPDKILVEIGETRKTTFAPAFLAFGPEIDMQTIANSHLIKEKKERRQARAQAIWQQVTNAYAHFPRP